MCSGSGLEGRADVGFLCTLKLSLGIGPWFLQEPGAAFDIEQFNGVSAFNSSMPSVRNSIPIRSRRMR